MDDNGHGTHIAGIIAATKNGKGTVGVAPDAEIYAIKVSDSRGKGSFSGLVKVINWAIENDMDVVTMSIITGERGSMSLRRVVDTAYGNHGLILLWQPSGTAAVEMSCTPQRTSRSSSEPSPRTMPDRCSLLDRK